MDNGERGEPLHCFLAVYAVSRLLLLSLLQLVDLDAAKAASEAELRGELDEAGAALAGAVAEIGRLETDLAGRAAELKHGEGREGEERELCQATCTPTVILPPHCQLARVLQRCTRHSRRARASSARRAVRQQWGCCFHLLAHTHTHTLLLSSCPPPTGEIRHLREVLATRTDELARATAEGARLGALSAQQAAALDTAAKGAPGVVNHQGERLCQHPLPCTEASAQASALAARDASIAALRARVAELEATVAARDTKLRDAQAAEKARGGEDGWENEEKTRREGGSFCGLS